MTTITHNFPVASYYFDGDGALDAHQLATLRRVVVREQIGAPLRTIALTSIETHKSLTWLRCIGLIVTISAYDTWVWQPTTYGRKVLAAAGL